MDVKKKIATAIAAGSLLAATLLPGAALASGTTNITISGNGIYSYNKAKVIKINSFSITQGNLTSVEVGAGVFSNTGDNSASGNTGGSSTIGTGTAVSVVSVGVGGSSNLNSPPPCGCDSGSTTINITGNGDFSTNKAKVVKINSSIVSQENVTLVGVEALTGSNTGNNSASGNTGGSSTVTTGTSTSSVGVSVTGSSNSN